MKINIIDSCMGSGKTSYMIEKIKNDKENKYIYITPFLSEVKRVKDNCKEKHFVEPINFGKGKQDNFHEMLVQDKNIVSTHALFRRSNEVTKELINSGNYILILDEVMDVIEQVPLKKDDIPNMLELKLIYIEDGFIKWNEDELEYSGRYDDIKSMAINNSLIYVNNVALMWNFPVDVFKSFKEVYILTYMFNSQIQKYYYDLYNTEYEYFAVDKVNNIYTLVKEKNDLDFKNNLKRKINILDDNINKIGEADYSLSVSWFRKSTSEPLLKVLKKNIYNYFNMKTKAKSKDIIWTTFIENKTKLSGAGYTKGFVPVNARATNDYKDRHNLAYCANIFLNPFVSKFFIDRGIDVKEDLYALSEMLQWIWRSAIRNNEEINIYIPSKRMRELLYLYLNNSIL